MKRFISTKFFRILQEASQKSIIVDADVLKNEYDEFATFIFAEFSNLQDLTAFNNALIFTISELKGMETQVNENGYFFFKQSDYFS